MLDPVWLEWIASSISVLSAAGKSIRCYLQTRADATANQVTQLVGEEVEFTQLWSHVGDFGPTASCRCGRMQLKLFRPIVGRSGSNIILKRS